MQTLYIISLILFTIILNTIITWLTPSIKVQWKLLISGIKRKLNKRKPVIDATQYIELAIRLDEYDEQLKTLTKRVMKVNEGNRELIRKTVREYLEELKTK